MRVPLSLAVLLAFSAFPAAADELARLQGTWKVVSLEKDGKKRSEDEIKGLKVIFKEDKFIIKEGDKEFEAVLKLDVGAKPKAIDLMVKQGDQSQTLKGIYHLDGDDLKICAAGAPGGDRPTEFATKPKAGVGLVVLKRESP